jgi:hypothetical protein
MLKVFQAKKKADTPLPEVLGSANQIEALFATVSLGEATRSSWGKCKARLKVLANAFQMSTSIN